MKKILLILSIFCLCFTFNEANAQKFVDISNYSFSDKWENVSFSIGGYDANPQSMFSTSDGGFVVIYSYKESGDLIPGVDENWNPTGTGTPESEHAKVVKFNKDFQKEWETNLFEIGTWANADPSAPTVRTELFQGTELEDGSFVFTGETGIGHPDAIYYRLDQNGKLLYKKRFKGLNPAHNPTAITNGGYIVKFKYEGGEKPTEFPVNASGYKYYYVVYDCENNIVDSFPEGEEAKLNNYEYYDINDKTNLIYNFKHSTLLYNTAGTSEKMHPDADNYIWYNELYMFTTMTGDKIYSFAEDQRNENDIKLYDSNGNLKNTILEAMVSYDGGVLSDTSYFTFTDGSFMIGNKIFDVNGNKIFDSNNVNQDYRPDKDEFSETVGGIKEFGVLSTVLCDDTLVRVISVYDRYSNDSFTYRIEFKKIMPKENNVFANLVIAGEEIITNAGTIFLENDRTYISISNLCAHLGCQYKRAESDNNMLVISFPVFEKNNKFFEGDIRFDYKKPGYVSGNSSSSSTLASTSELYKYLDKAYYVVEHKIESKFYQTYLDITPYNIFSLKSPTYNADSVDVESKVIDGEVFVPLRFVAEALGRYVTYIPGTDGGKPTIKISAAGEGEFYEKYGVIVTKQQYYDGDTISNKESSSTISLGSQKLYGYGIDKLSDKVLNNNHTIFFPLVFEANKVYSSFVDRSGNMKDNSNYYLGYFFYTADDRLGGVEYGFSCKMNYLWREVTPVFDGSNKEFPILTELPYLVISSMEGYPFLKIVYVGV